MPLCTRNLAVLSVVLLLASCAPRPVVPPTSPHAVPAAPAARAVTAYRFDPARSSLAVHVYRGGAMARLGHNHVVEARALEGRLRLAEPLEASTLEFGLPVADLVVDAPEARAAAGADFPGVPPADAVAGTRRNMLGKALLDAATFPTVVVRTLAVAPAPGGARLTLQLDVKGVTTRLDVPVELVVRGDELEARGEVEVSQRALGLTPFSVIRGVLEVQDAMRVAFHVVAVREPA